MRLATLAGLLLACCARGLFAQETQPIKLPVVEGRDDIRVVHVPVGNGPVPRQVHQIVQDNQGFLWFSSQDGLKRYDGYEFKTYRPDTKKSNSLSGVFINSLFKDRFGMLWIGSDTYLDSYDPKTGTFRHFEGIHSQVYDINQDREGSMWLATNDGLLRLEPTTGRTIRYRNSPSDPASLSSNLARATFQDRQGTFWVATAKGLDVLDLRTGKVTRHFAMQIAGTFLASLFEDHSGILWLTYTTGNGLASLDPKTGIVTSYSFHQVEPERSLIAGVNAILEDEDGTLWLGTQGSGLLKLDKSRKEFVRYQNDPSDPSSLSGNSVSSLLEDREGNIWLGTGGEGIDHFPGKPLAFKNYRNQPGNRNSLGNDFVVSAYKDGRGILWVGTRAVLNRIDAQSGQFSFYRAAGGPGNLSNTNVFSIVEDRSGYLWFGTLGGGLNRLDGRTGQFTVYRHDPNDPHTLSDDVVGSLLVDRKGTLWVGTDNGLNRFDPATQHFVAYRVNGKDVSRYHAIAEDSDGALWLGSWEAGLQRFDPATGRFTVYRHAVDDLRSLSNNRVNSVYVDSSGTIWAGTQSGLDRFNQASRKFAAFDEHDGLPNSTIISILGDDRGDLWLGTNNGLSRFNPRTGSFRNYYASDGLPGNEFNGYGTAHRTSNGEMFFCSYRGLVTFFPDQIVDSSYVPPVVLTDLLLFGNPVSPGEDSPLKQPISVTSSIALVHSQNNISFEFSSLSYASPERNRYRYRLEGLDKQWNETDSHRRFASYTTLSPGNYIFRVQGSNNRGKWNESGVSVHIQLLPPWWSTWWLRASVVAALLLLLWCAYHIRVRQLARQFNMRLEERVSERTRIARDLHDTLLQSFQGVLLRFQTAHVLFPTRPADAQRILESTIDQAAHAITEGREAVQGLRASTVETNDLVPAITKLGEELTAEASGDRAVGLCVEVQGVPRSLHPIVRDEVYRILGEALRNAIRHAEANQIEVELRYAERQFRLQIRDDGKGIDPKFLGAQGREGHFGLHGMRERAKLIRGKLTVWTAPGSGTEIELSMPAAYAYAASTDARRSWLAKLAGTSAESTS